jgi:hypothetical protein
MAKPTQGQAKARKNSWGWVTFLKKFYSSLTKASILPNVSNVTYKHKGIKVFSQLFEDTSEGINEAMPLKRTLVKGLLEIREFCTSAVEIQRYCCNGPMALFSDDQFSYIM